MAAPLACLLALSRRSPSVDSHTTKSKQRIPSHSTRTTAHSNTGGRYGGRPAAPAALRGRVLRLCGRRGQQWPLPLAALAGACVRACMLFGRSTLHKNSDWPNPASNIAQPDRPGQAPLYMAGEMVQGKLRLNAPSRITARAVRMKAGGWVGGRDWVISMTESNLIRPSITTVRGPRARALDAGQREEQAHVQPDGAALRPAQPHAAGCVRARVCLYVWCTF